MRRFVVSEFDSDTFIVLDRLANREICICSNYEVGMDAGIRAKLIAESLNEQKLPQLKPDRALMHIQSRRRDN